MTYRQPFKGEYPITQKFGEVISGVTYKNEPHTGIDYACPLGTNILACEDGYVFFAGWNESGYGNMIMIRHNDGNASLYAHLSLIRVYVGQTVRKGEKIGESGTSGNSTGPHLHFELRNSYGKPFDPMTVLQTASDAEKFEKNEKKNLKEADDLPELVRVVAPAGARRFNGDWSYAYPSTYNYGQVLHFTGNTMKRKGYPYTYCEVYEEPKKYWVAVHNEDTQILDE